MKRKNNGFWWIILVAAILFGFPSLSTIFRVGFGILGIGVLVVFALVIALIVFLIVKAIGSASKKDGPNAPNGAGSGQKTVHVSSENGKTTVYAQKTVNPYSSHQTSRPQPQPEPEPAPAPEPKKEEPVSTGNKELDLVLRQGREYVAKMEELNGQIPDFKVSARIKQIGILTEKIFQYVQTHPEDIHRTRQLLSYYLPTTVKLLERYIELQSQGIRVGNIDEGMQKVEDLLDKLAVAFQQQLDGLFEDDLVDITADIQVMEQMLASEGLTGTKDF